MDCGASIVGLKEIVSVCYVFHYVRQKQISLPLNRQLRNLEYGNNICTLEVCVYNYFLTMFTVMWVRLLQKNGIIKVV